MVGVSKIAASSGYLINYGVGNDAALLLREKRTGVIIWQILLLINAYPLLGGFQLFEFFCTDFRMDATLFIFVIDQNHVAVRIGYQNQNLYLNTLEIVRLRPLL